ncbi:10074_t:CDS:2 [Paraglomus occultum]|uniref:10074_t:CDS:1 n=1 Tax=Paraglomus occultum TaxID=144539 RepID=A0A9N9C7Z5_9GLOM|nr:10074_t:CDS:2 [Paraglomus occultum]
MTVTLPYEVLRAVLDVYADDGATLHSCILINKNWFAIAIQYLWAKPFNLMCKNARSYKKSDRSKRAANLLQSFVECITTFDAVFEKMCLHNKESNKKSPLDYSEYVKELNWTDVCSVVWSLSRLDTAVNSIHADKDSRVECITAKIIAMAVQYCTELQFLSLEPRELSTHNYLQSCFASIKSLPRLRHFSWGSSMSETDALCQLATIAQNLESVTINHCHQNVEFISENIALLVRSQHRLKSFTVKHGDLEMHAILDLLQVCANSLESITFSGVVLRQNQETESVRFPKLKCIKIDTCTHISSSSWEPLLAADFPNLREFVCKTHDSKGKEFPILVARP